MKPMNANELLAGLALARPVPITAVVTDSRKVQPGCIFVCFPGERVDGHDYAATAVWKIVMDEVTGKQNPPPKP